MSGGFSSSLIKDNSRLLAETEVTMFTNIVRMNESFSNVNTVLSYLLRQLKGGRKVSALVEAINTMTGEINNIINKQSGSYYSIIVVHTSDPSQYCHLLAHPSLPLGINIMGPTSGVPENVKHAVATAINGQDGLLDMVSLNRYEWPVDSGEIKNTVFITLEFEDDMRIFDGTKLYLTLGCGVNTVVTKNSRLAKLELGQ